MKSGSRLFSQATVKGVSTETSMAKCKSLEAAIPRLREVFHHKSNNEHVFPLFSPRTHELVWKTVPIDARRQAAVLVPLVSYEGVPSLLFTTRSSHLPTHANEVSFPGGHYDASKDQNLHDTAIREAREELGGVEYPWDQVEILGKATPLPSIKGTPVTPVIGVLPYEISATTFPGDDNEVTEIFYVSLMDLINMETTEYNRRFRSNIPVYPVEETKRIWGLTAVITRPLLHKLFKPVFLEQSVSKL